MAEAVSLLLMSHVTLGAAFDSHGPSQREEVEGKGPQLPIKAIAVRSSKTFTLLRSRTPFRSRTLQEVAAFRVLEACDAICSHSGVQ